MALSYATYNGDGSTTQFAVPFQYLSRTHVTVTVDGAPAAFTWTSPSVVNLSSAPANGTVVEVRRTTPRDNPLVDFSDGSTLTERDLDTMALHSFFLAQEAFDAAGGTLSINPDGSYGAGGRRISQLGTAVNPNDAVSLTQVTGLFNADKLYVDAAKAEANQHRLDALDHREGANLHKLGAQTAQTQAEAARDKALAWADAGYGAEVEPGKYSARHWAQLAQQIANQSAAGITFVPAGNIAATNVQTAIEELDSEKFGAMGGTFTGKVVTKASDADGAGFNIPHGSAPSSPVNGDLWTTTTQMFVRLGGSTRTIAVLQFNNSWSGKQTFRASTTNDASIRLQTGVDPTSPDNGDMWQTGSALKVRLNGATYTVALDSDITALQTAVGNKFDKADKASAADIRNNNTADKVITTDAMWAAAVHVNKGNVSGTITPDFDEAINFHYTQVGNITVANPLNMKPGQSGVLVIEQDNTGGRTIAWGSAWAFADLQAPTISTNAGRKNVVSYYVHYDGRIYASVIKGCA